MKLSVIWQNVQNPCLSDKYIKKVILSLETQNYKVVNSSQSIVLVQFLSVYLQFFLGTRMWILNNSR